MIDRSHEIDYKLNTHKPTCAVCGATGDGLDNPCAQSPSLDEALTQIITEAAIYGKAAGIYRTTHTGIAVESFYHPGSVQIYPINALFTWRVKK